MNMGMSFDSSGFLLVHILDTPLQTQTKTQACRGASGGGGGHGGVLTVVAAVAVVTAAPTLATSRLCLRLSL